MSGRVFACALVHSTDGIIEISGGPGEKSFGQLLGASPRGIASDRDGDALKFRPSSKESYFDHQDIHSRKVRARTIEYRKSWNFHRQTLLVIRHRDLCCFDSHLAVLWRGRQLD